MYFKFDVLLFITYLPILCSVSKKKQFQTSKYISSVPKFQLKYLLSFTRLVYKMTHRVSVSISYLDFEPTIFYSLCEIYSHICYVRVKLFIHRTHATKMKCSRRFKHQIKKEMRVLKRFLLCFFSVIT